MLSRKFTRTKENFVCENCHYKVQGNGYTNHCPACLYSKHVDIHPGDRAEECQGMMKPVAWETVHGDIYIVHECLRCGFKKRNKLQPGDNQEILIEISRQEIYGEK